MNNNMLICSTVILGGVCMTCCFIGHVRRRHAELVHCGARHLQRRVPYLHRVMLDPAGVGEYLRELLLRGGADTPRLVKEYTAGACRPLVETHYVFPLRFSFYIFSCVELKCT